MSHCYYPSRNESTLCPSVCVFQGKTLTTIALILTNFHHGKPLPVEKCVSAAVLNMFLSVSMQSDGIVVSHYVNFLFACVQEEGSSPIKAKIKPQMASKLEGRQNF